jgi:hypothetical protein
MKAPPPILASAASLASGLRLVLRGFSDEAVEFCPILVSEAFYAQTGSLI